MIKVLIVEDHPIVREGVTTVLERERDIDVVGSAETIGEGLRLAGKLNPDVVLLDLKLPDADNFDGVASFAREGRSIVVFTAYDGDDDVFRAIRGGARGYLLKGSPAADIAEAVRQVHAGESYLSPRIAAKLVKGVTQPRGRTGPLSARERRAAAGCRRTVQPSDCGHALDLGANGQVSRDRDLQQARRRQPRAGGGDGRRARAAFGPLTTYKRRTRRIRRDVLLCEFCDFRVDRLAEVLSVRTGDSCPDGRRRRTSPAPTINP